jgi:hypothetical protein
MLKESILGKLREALKERLAIIADKKLRDCDPAEHLKELQAVSEKIEGLIKELSQEKLDPHFRHYLKQCSYGKALQWIEASIDQ